MVKNLPAMQETQVHSLGQEDPLEKEMEDPLEKEMATHSIIFAWRIPWTEEPGGLYSMGSQRVKLSTQHSGPDGKESACNAGDRGLIPGSGRYPGEVNGYPLQYSCLENSMDRGSLWATVHGVTKSCT